MITSRPSIALMLEGCFMSSLAVAQDGRAVRNECYQGHTTAERKACLEEKETLTDAKIRTLESRIRSEMATSTTEAGHQRQVAFESAAKEFDRYKTSRCSQIARMARGIDDHNSLRRGCAIELNTDRIDQLNALLSSTDRNK